MKIIRKQSRGSILVEFALSIILYSAFLYGLIVASMWAIGGTIVHDAAITAAQIYAVELDSSKAAKRAVGEIGRWGYVFVDPSTIHVTVEQIGDTAHATVTAQPRIQKAFFYTMPALKREASCTMEYRFRRPGEFL